MPHSLSHPSLARLLSSLAHPFAFHRCATRETRLTALASSLFPTTTIRVTLVTVTFLSPPSLTHSSPQPRAFSPQPHFSSAILQHNSPCLDHVSGAREIVSSCSQLCRVSSLRFMSPTAPFAAAALRALLASSFLTQPSHSSFPDEDQQCTSTARVQVQLVDESDAELPFVVSAVNGSTRR